MEGRGLRSWASLGSVAVGEKKQADDQTVQTDGLGENDDEQKTHVQARLLADSLHTIITDNTHTVTRSIARQTNANTAEEVGKTLVKRISSTVHYRISLFLVFNSEQQGTTYIR